MRDIKILADTNIRYNILPFWPITLITDINIWSAKNKTSFVQSEKTQTSWLNSNQHNVFSPQHLDSIFYMSFDICSAVGAAI